MRARYPERTSQPPRYPERSHGAIFKRLETDSEFRKRLIQEGTPIPSWDAAARGEELDNYAWGHWRKQRRIVEAVAER